MKKLKKALALLSAAMLLCSAVSCAGKDTSGSSVPSGSGSRRDAEDVTDEEDDEDEDDDESDSDSGEKEDSRGVSGNDDDSSRTSDETGKTDPDSSRDDAGRSSKTDSSAQAGTPSMDGSLDDFLEGTVWFGTSESDILSKKAIVWFSDGNLYQLVTYDVTANGETVPTGYVEELIMTLDELDAAYYSELVDNISSDRREIEMMDTKISYVGTDASDLPALLMQYAGYEGISWDEILDNVTDCRGYNSYQEVKDAFVSIAEQYGVGQSAEAAAAMFSLCYPQELKEMRAFAKKTDGASADTELAKLVAEAVLEFEIELIYKGLDKNWELTDYADEYITAAELNPDKLSEEEKVLITLGMEAAAGGELMFSFNEDYQTEYVLDDILFVCYGGKWYLSAIGIMDECS